MIAGIVVSSTVNTEYSAGNFYLYEVPGKPIAVQLDFDVVDRLLQEIMRESPPWWPELVLWSEGDIARSYGDAK